MTITCSRLKMYRENNQSTFATRQQQQLTQKKQEWSAIACIYAQSPSILVFIPCPSLPFFDFNFLLFALGVVYFPKIECVILLDELPS